MLLISSHIDRVRNDIPLSVKEGKLCGLLDNYLGNFIALSIMSNPSVRELEKQGKIKFFFNQHEEFGLNVNFPKLDSKKDFVINVDVCCNKRYKNKDIGIENAFHTSTFAIDGLEWEGHKIYYKEYDSDPSECDEMDQWVEKGIPGCSFIIPIEASNNNWHGEASITFEKIQKSILILERLICYMV